jgi:elongation factor Ts
MKISLDLIKELRHLTSCSVAECRKTLEQTGGDIKKAQELLRKKGLDLAESKKDRLAKEGSISSYVHLGAKIGVLVEVSCETDFVARNEDFNRFGKDVAMQIAATKPQFIKREDAPTELLDEHKDKEQFIKEVCLLEQPFIKNQAITIKDYLGELVVKIGENISIRRFVRFSIKEGVNACGI